MSRIDATFARLREQGRKALIPFVTAGFPQPDITPELMWGMADAGADVIELGVPFSDPSADGPVIQKAGDRALAAGMALCDAPYVAVFDADFVPAPDWLRRAMAAMLVNPKAAFVQTRIEWGNGERNWLTRAQRLMHKRRTALARRTATGQITRRRAFKPAKTPHPHHSAPRMRIH